MIGTIVTSYKANYSGEMRIAAYGLAVARVTLGLGAFCIWGWGQANSVLPQVPPGNAETQGVREGLATVETDGVGKPLPDVPSMMREVEIHQRVAEAVLKNYLYHAVQTTQEVDGNGSVKKTTTREYDNFWVSGVPVRRLVTKDGKELSTEEQKKESERIDKEAAKAREKREKQEAAGKETDPRGNEEITVSRILELGRFTNPRRVTINGRDTIAVDYAGDPKARTRNRSEEVIRDLVGTVWVDEHDRMICKTEGHFLNAFKVGAGVLMNIRKDTSFSLEMKKVNDEVWLPARIRGEGAARALLVFHFDGRFQEVDAGYRKFKATSTILPGMNKVEESGAPTVPVPQ